MAFSHFDFKYIDCHCHFFPNEIFKAIWNYFEKPNEEGTIIGWPIKYKSNVQELVEILKNNNVTSFTTYNYAHKGGVAEFINGSTIKISENYRNAIPFGCLLPDDKNKISYISKLFDEYNFYGIKVQPLVQNFHANDERMYPIYDIIIDKGKWFAIHAGTAPYRNDFVGYKYFKKFIDKYPDMNVIVAHMGAFEYEKFINLLDKHENLYLDTAMIYIPDNIFPERKLKRIKKEILVSYQDRILFGSDFPNIPYDYDYSTKGLFEMEFSKDFYNKIFFENAQRIFKL
jgi:hypothetical protein